ncbi:hypothetical protein Dsin_005953 [Dipteronia sinensis]|uniref:C2 domain-containing protein n=1 Tax=Dipteronia sinensis TaxID=43782 RepID=A0AAE0AXG9_9ROSI|nr:hypothetical protein Dsin_005953 [Dipteronia sinensis]
MVASNDHQYLSSLSCEVGIIKAKNIEYLKSNSSTSTGGVFVRYYLSGGNNKTSIQLNSKEISSSSPSKSESDDDEVMMIWNESFSLECVGTEDSIKNLNQQSVVFELRWRPDIKASSLKYLLGKKKSKSKLLGRAEIPWKTVFESPNLEIQNWVVMVPDNYKINNSARVLDQDHVLKLAAPSLQVSMKVVIDHQVPKMVEKKKINKSSLWVDECGCSDDHHNHGGCNCADYEIFALVAALESL